jgi:hypothetical protein
VSRPSTAARPRSRTDRCRSAASPAP